MSQPRPDLVSPPERSSWLRRLMLPPEFDVERSASALTWAEAVFEPFALVAVVSFFILGLIQFGSVIFPTWPNNFLVPLIVFVGIEGFFYSRRLTHSVFRAKEWLVLLVPAVVLARFLPHLDRSGRFGDIDLGSWLTNPAGFFTIDFVFDVLLLLLSWSLVVGCTQLLNGLRLQPGEIIEETDSRKRQILEDNWRAIDHSAPLRQLGELFVYGCVIVVFLSSLSSLGTARFGSIEAIGRIIGFQLPSVHLVLFNVIAYVVLGLLLLGEAHYVRQRTLWRVERLDVPGDVSAHWGGGLTGLVLIAVTIAFILPTSYAMTLGDLVGALVSIVLQIGLFFMGLVIYLFSLLSRLIGLKGGPDTATPAATRPSRPVVPPPPTGSPLDAIGSIVFWLVVLGIVGYTLYVLWRRRPAWAMSFNIGHFLTGPWNFLRSLFRAIRRVGEDVGRAVMSAIPRIFRTDRVSLPRVPRFIALSRLGPRELVEYYYLSVCERAARLGYPRPDDLTPDEYLQWLRERLPIVDPEIETLTAAFLEARFSSRPTMPDRPRELRGGWETLKKKLRSARLRRLTAAERAPSQPE